MEREVGRKVGRKARKGSQDPGGTEARKRLKVGKDVEGNAWLMRRTLCSINASSSFAVSYAIRWLDY